MVTWAEFHVLETLSLCYFTYILQVFIHPSQINLIFKISQKNTDCVGLFYKCVKNFCPEWISGVSSQDGDIYPLKTLKKLNLPAFTITPYPAFDSVGAKIIMACRDMDRAQAAVKDVMERSGNQNIVCMKLDLADSKSIREFAEAVNQG